MSRKQQITEAVLEIISTKGFSADFTMSSLAKKLDIGKSTIYEYFENKDEIIKDAIYLYFDRKIEVVNMLDDVSELSFEDAFKKQLTILLDVAQESRSVLEALAPGFIQKLPENMRDDMKKRVELTRDRMQIRFMSFFEKAYNEGIVKCEATPNTGLVITSLVVGSIMVFSDPRNNADTTTFVDEVYNNIIKILS